jgi:hypothetical protein
MIARRAIVTGLAAVAVAGVLPRRVAHFREPATNEINIRHLDSGLAFASHPAATGPRAFLLVNTAAAALLPPHAVRIISSAVPIVAVRAMLIWSCRPQHQGAIYFRYRPDADPDDPYYHPLTEDAPPLPRFAA